MTEKIEIWLPKAKNTTSCGRSLATSLYTVPLTLFLHGELGVGKTTFLQGFAEGLGIKERLTSPTYALEQRYRIPFEGTPPDGRGHRGGGKMENNIHEPHTPPPLSSPYGGGAPVGREKMDLLHIDLYRINPKEAKEMVESSADFEGIRCIEWSEKLSEQKKTGPHIDLHIQDGHKNFNRHLSVQFHDLPLPSPVQVKTWRKQLMVLTPICEHCDIVGKFAERLAHALLKRGIIVRPKALRRAGELHDLFRFLDFNESISPEPNCWNTWKKHYPNIKHELACALFLRDKGFDGLARIIAPHGLPSPPHERMTIEQKVLYYADKRVIDRVVSIDERFEYFAQRYSKGGISKKHIQWYEEVRTIEKELFPQGVPLPLGGD